MTMISICELHLKHKPTKFIDLMSLRILNNSINQELEILFQEINISDWLQTWFTAQVIRGKWIPIWSPMLYAHTMKTHARYKNLIAPLANKLQW